MGESKRETAWRCCVCCQPCRRIVIKASAPKAHSHKKLHTRYLNNAEKVTVMCSGGVYHAKYAFARARERVGRDVAPKAEIFAPPCLQPKQNSSSLYVHPRSLTHRSFQHNGKLWACVQVEIRLSEFESHSLHIFKKLHRKIGFCFCHLRKEMILRKNYSGSFFSLRAQILSQMKGTFKEDNVKWIFHKSLLMENLWWRERLFLISSLWNSREWSHIQNPSLFFQEMRRM